MIRPLDKAGTSADGAETSMPQLLGLAHLVGCQDRLAVLQLQREAARTDGTTAQADIERIYVAARDAGQAALTAEQTADVRRLEESRRIAHLRVRALGAILDLDAKGLSLLVGSGA